MYAAMYSTELKHNRRYAMKRTNSLWVAVMTSYEMRESGISEILLWSTGRMDNSRGALYIAQTSIHWPLGDVGVKLKV